MAPLKQRLLVRCVLLLAMAHWTSGQSRSCTNTQSTFDGLRILDANGQLERPAGVVYDQFKTGGSDGVCKLSQTCCSAEAEQSFKYSTVKDYRDGVVSLLSSSLMDCHGQPIFRAFKEYINGSKANLISDMFRAFSIYFQPYQNIFDTFFDYLLSAVDSGDTCQLRLEYNLVSFEVFLAAYVGLDPNPFVSNHAYRQCVYNYFLESNAIPLENTYRGFSRSFTHLFRYFRALKLIESLVENVLNHRLSPQCDSALMKMSYCSQCAGYSSSLYQPCQALCTNTLRGCLVDLADLQQPIRELSQALATLQKSLEDIHRPWLQLTLLTTHFFNTVTRTTQNTNSIEDQIRSRCAGASGSQSKRQAPAGGSQRSTRVDLVPPLTELNDSSHCLIRNIGLFSSLPESVCDSEAVATGNDNCWTGQTIGSYGRSVIDYNRQAQRNNPELLICSRVSSFAEDISRLSHMTRELNAVTMTTQQVCSPDDEDCLSFSVSPTCHYYDLSDVGSEGGRGVESGSGAESGSGGVEGGECGGVTPTPPSLITTVDTSSMTSTQELSTTASEEGTTNAVFTGPGGTGSVGPIGTVGVEGTDGASPPIPGSTHSPVAQDQTTEQFGKATTLSFSLTLTLLTLALSCWLILS